MFFNYCLLMNIYYMNQSHSIHCSDNQVQAIHDLVYGIIGRLSPANHHRASTHGTVGDFVFEPVNHKGNALIHEIVQVGGHSGHLRHHPNLKKRVKVMRRRRQNVHEREYTHRKTVVHQTMAMVAAISPRYMQSHNHLIPMQSLA